MEARELRIGNWVDTFTGIHRISAVATAHIVLFGYAYRDDPNGGTYAIDEIDPIPLTPEILEKAGFVSNGNKVEATYSFGDFSYTGGWFHQRAIDGKTFVALNLNVKHLHQLQNLYFALTGEELKIEL